MSLEWFSRMEHAVRLSLPDICEDFDEFDIAFHTYTTERHPSFSFSIQDADGEEEFCIIHFDPINQEFYTYHYHDEADLQCKVLFSDADQILSFVHVSFHEYIGDIDDDYIFEEDVDDIDDYIDTYEADIEDEDMALTDGDVTEYDENIEWISNDKHIHIEDNTVDLASQYTIHLKLGRDKYTGDGVLFRKTIINQNEEEGEERIMLFFKDEEASYIADLFQEYLSQGSLRG